MNELLQLTFFYSAIRLSTPLIFAALGGLYSERSGIINIALEGLMLAGAFTAAAVTATTGSALIGVSAAILAGVALALIHAVATIRFRADQVVSGTAINILMLGLPQLLSGAFFLSSGSTPQILKENLLPDIGTFLLKALVFMSNGYVLTTTFIVVLLVIYLTIYSWLLEPTKATGGHFANVISRILASLGISLLIFMIFWFGISHLIAQIFSYQFFHNISVASVLALLLVPATWYVLFRTPFGLRLRAVGENPEAADAAGVSVVNMRYTAVLLSGALAAFGGAYLSIGQSSLFTRNMTAGRGFIALAALIFGKWKPLPTLLACLLFGFTEAASISLQGLKNSAGEELLPTQFIQIIPYVLTIVILAGFIGHARAPKALGRPYEKQ